MGEYSSYELLLNRLDRFIRKYYINQLLRGVLVSVAVCVGLFIVYAVLESQFYLSTFGRKTLFFSYLLVFSAVFIGLVLAPLASYFKLGKVLTHDEASRIIGKHFNNVEDKLLNILQLRGAAAATDNNQLILAGIDQKADEIKLVPFTSAIDLSENKKYLRYALPPLLMLIFMLFAAPSLITDSAYRIINNDKEFDRPAPFTILIANDKLETVQYDNYELLVNVEGDQLPNDLFIKVDDYEYRMTKDAKDRFSYVFNNVRKDTPFEIYSTRARSGSKTLKVLSKPKVLNFDVRLNFPKHTGRSAESISNIGDLSVPEGTQLQWVFNTRSTDAISLIFDEEEAIALRPSGSTRFTFDKRIMKDHDYSLVLSNQWVEKGDSLKFFLRAIRDENPAIDVEMVHDSLAANIFYFVGSASDDYGLTKLVFHYDQLDEQGVHLHSGDEPIPFSIRRQTDYTYILDLEKYNLKPGHSFSYYFEVYDNDGIRGAKSSRTVTMTHRKKSLEELKVEEQLNEEQVKNKLDEAIDESQAIREELQKLREKLLQKKEPDWQDKKQLEKLMERQKQVQEKLEEARQANEKNLQNANELNNSPEITQKQERIQELFEETLKSEMQELMEQIRQLMQELNKDQTVQMLENRQLNEEKLQKEMERLRELYKQLEVEKEIKESIEELEKLAEKLDQLSQETRQEQKPNEELSDEQKGVEEKFEELQKKMEDINKKNDQLEFKKPIPNDMPEQMKDAAKDMDKAQDQLQKQENKKASDSQKSASQKMKKMASQMQQQMMSGEQDQMAEDIKTLRQLLENLVNLSFTQEDLITDVSRAVINTPRYVALVKDHKKLQDDFKIVEDTLIALSKRQAQLETFVIEKVTDIKGHIKASLYNLEDRKKPEASQEQRSTMKNLNDLALMLSEAMKQMQEQMASMMSGSQMCQKPGDSSGSDGNVPMDKISEGQEGMDEKLQEMMEKMKEGKGNSSKDFAEAAAKQAAMRKALEDLRKSQQELGQGFDDNLQQIIDEMNKQEIDLVNKRLDSEMMKRQQNIMTRLLDADRAQREREYDDQRQSESAQDTPRKLPPSLEQYLKDRKAVLEQYKYVSPQLRPYYRQLVDDYYKNLKQPQ